MTTGSDDEHHNSNMSSSAAFVKHRRIRATSQFHPQSSSASAKALDATGTPPIRSSFSYLDDQRSSILHALQGKQQQHRRGRPRRPPWYSFRLHLGGSAGGGNNRVTLLFLLALLSSPFCLFYAIRYSRRHSTPGLYHSYDYSKSISDLYYPRMVTMTPTRHESSFSTVSRPPTNNNSNTFASAVQQWQGLVPRIVLPMSDDPYLLHRTLSPSAADRDNMSAAFETTECQAQWAWQTQSIPTCNPIHEVDLANPLLLQHRRQQHPIVGNDKDETNNNRQQREALRLVANGYWRDVWIVQSTMNTSNGIINPPQQQQQQDASSSLTVANNNKFVLKTIRIRHPFIPRNFDRHRRDAMAMERLTSSPYIVNIYAFCGNSGAFEYADGGDISTALWPPVAPVLVPDQTRGRRSFTTTKKTMRVPANLTSLERFHIGLQAAKGVAAVHNVDQEGRASIAHTDISPTQFVKVNNRYKLNDFNRARLLTWNTTSHELCPYHIQLNPGKNRSPEEYNYEPQTEKVDVFSLGNIFYMLLMLELPFHEFSPKDAAKKIKTGERPSFYADVWDSPDPYIQALKSAMIMCHQHNVTARATARQVETFLKGKFRELDPQRYAAWGR